jgi:hypothetical protein
MKALYTRSQLPAMDEYVPAAHCTHSTSDDFVDPANDMRLVRTYQGCAFTYSSPILTYQQTRTIQEHMPPQCKKESLPKQCQVRSSSAFGRRQQQLLDIKASTV